MSYASSSVYPFNVDREVARYLAGVKHLPNQEHVISFLRLISFFLLG
jgi:hypothetical protein